jgi:ribosomal protein S18 acetylase RimI-like enzyme
MVNELLNNPVYFALLTGDASRACGTEHVKFFNEKISPFAGFEEGYERGFEALHAMLPPGRNILYATRKEINTPKGWKLVQHVAGLQFILTASAPAKRKDIELVSLQEEHVDQMVQLANLTRPGPFDTRTIEFGNYYGIFHHNRLVAMAGQRLYVAHYTEVSAVCTHPDYEGRSYARALLQHQLQLITEDQQIPFLHVRADNKRAIALYERIGFTVNGEMNFYFLEKEA